MLRNGIVQQERTGVETLDRLHGDDQQMRGARSNQFVRIRIQMQSTVPRSRFGDRREVHQKTMEHTQIRSAAQSTSADTPKFPELS